MTGITINLKDFITLGFLILTAVTVWLKIRKLQSNDLHDIREELADYRIERARHDVEVGERLRGLEVGVKELRRDIDRLNKN